MIEITERETIEEMERLKRNVAACRAAGFRVAADDVGAGNAGLRLLSQIQFDIVKIDLSLVQEGALYETSLAVVGSLQELARRWGAWVIAEGIETPEQLRVVRELDISAGQGYLLGRPNRPRTCASSTRRRSTCRPCSAATTGCRTWPAIGTRAGRRPGSS